MDKENEERKPIKLNGKRVEKKEERKRKKTGLQIEREDGIKSLQENGARRKQEEKTYEKRMT